MTRHIRTRTSNDAAPPEGSRIRDLDSGSTTIKTNSTIAKWDNSYMVDYVGRPISDSPLTFGRIKCVSIEGLSGQAYDSIDHATITCDNYITGHLRDIDNYSSHINPSGWPSSETSFVTTALARSNPSRPGYSTMSLLQDFTEAPKLLRDSGLKYLRRHPLKSWSRKEIANWNLCVRFGWLPFISDLKKLLELQSYTAKRFAELNRLGSSDGLKRRLNLLELSSQSDSVDFVMTGEIPSLTCNINTIVRGKEWAVCKWQPQSVKNSFGNAKHNRTLAYNLARDATSFSTIKDVWDVLPWTWLAGWFTNIGDFAIANANTVGAKCTMIDLMGQFRIDRRLTRASGSAGFKGGNAEFQTEWKYRTIHPNPSAVGVFEPMLSSDRLSVVDSLFVQRLR